MLPGLSLPPSFVRLLAEVRPCFTAPTFATFCALVCGMLAQTGRRTVCGMLVGAGLSRVWSHDRAHKFFSVARWSTQQLSALLAALVVRLLLALTFHREVAGCPRLIGVSTVESAPELGR